MLLAFKKFIDSNWISPVLDNGVRGETLLSVVRLCGELTRDGGEAETLGGG